MLCPPPACFLVPLVAHFSGLKMADAWRLPPSDFQTESNTVHHLVSRDAFLPNQLWNITGPSIKDVRQKSVLDCWWAAASVAILNTSPEWTQSLLLDPVTNTSFLNYTTTHNASPKADNLNVILFDPHTLTPHVLPASIFQRSQTEDFGMRGYWWNDALTQGLLALGKEVDILGVTKQGKIDGNTGSASQPLSVLTGYSVEEKLFSTYSETDQSGDSLWADLSRAPKTPVVFATISNPTKTMPEIGDNHAYPVLRTEEDQQGRWVVARNVWGRTDRLKLEDVRANGWLLAHLKDWRGLEWEELVKRVEEAVDR